MAWRIASVLISGIVISLSSWLASRRPGLAGFILALPISSMTALILFQAEFRDAARASEYARSIFLAVPLSLVFFVPFLFSEKLGLSFPALYALGVALLGGAYLVHSRLFGG